jgi:hypothetical protein
MLVNFSQPPGTRGVGNTTNWVARGVRGGRQSVFNDRYGAFLSVMAHEIGYVNNLWCSLVTVEHISPAIHCTLIFAWIFIMFDDQNVRWQKTEGTTWD